MNQTDKDAILAILAQEPTTANIKVTRAPSICDSRWDRPFQVKAGATINVDSGAWIGDDDSFEVKWLRNGVPIDGASGMAFVTSGDDVGTAINAVVASVVPAGKFAIATDAIEVVDFSPVEMVDAPVVGGDFYAGGFVYGSDGRWFGADYTVYHEWSLNDVSFSTNDGVNVPEDAVSGDVLRWTVVATDNQGNTATASVETTL